MTRSFSHFTNEERMNIGYLHNLNTSTRDIAKMLGRPDHSSIVKEINRNKDPVTDKYLYGKADKLAVGRRLEINSTLIKILPSSKLEEYIISKLKLNWSPEQISGRMKKKLNMLEFKKLSKVEQRELNSLEHTVSHETIYKYIQTERPDLKPLLRFNKGKYKRKYRTKIREREREKSKKKRIDTREDIVDKRERIGDWEGDTIVGGEKSTHILTLVERKSGYLMADKIDTGTAEETKDKIIKNFNMIPIEKRKTLTLDNGVQFSKHDTIESKLQLLIYFAHIYCSWERGTNENTNGLLRQYYPKKTKFIPITKEQLDKTVKLINTRPRKRLNYSTPEEVFKGGALRN